MIENKSVIERESLASYEIPANFVAENTVLWGMFKTRRAVEAGIILGFFIFLTLNVIKIQLVSLFIFIVLGIPLAVVALIGPNDGPFSEFLIDFVKHLRRKKTICYDKQVLGIKEEINETKTKKEE